MTWLLPWPVAGRPPNNRDSLRGEMSGLRGGTSLEKKYVLCECTFCGSPITVTPDARAVANPQGVLPFKLEKQVASAEFDKWLHKLWFAPNDLKKSASSDRFNGIYLPFWTFDADTESGYQASAANIIMN